MRLSEIRKSVNSYCNRLKVEEFKTQRAIVLGALADVEHNKDDFHLRNLHELLVEMKTTPEYQQSEKCLGLCDKAITTVTNEMER